MPVSRYACVSLCLCLAMPVSRYARVSLCLPRSDSLAVNGDDKDVALLWRERLPAVK